MDFFFFPEEELATPPLDGIILPGVTRQSILELARKWVKTVKTILSDTKCAKMYLQGYNSLSLGWGITFKKGPLCTLSTVKMCILVP